jgi:hypothetical protein
MTTLTVKRTPKAARYDGLRLEPSKHDQLLADTWMSNGQNGSEAYRSLHPRALPSTYGPAANKILSKPEVQKYIENKLDKYDAMSLEAIEKDLIWAREAAKDKEDYSAVSKIAMDAAKLRAYVGGNTMNLTLITAAEQDNVRRLVVAQLQSNTPDED